jgi:hypothetical protein
MNNQINPFATDRAEQLGDNLFRFYADHKRFDGLLKLKSLIIQGGRGSGKTMFFLYHTYFNKKKEGLSLGKKFNIIFNDLGLIGVHFRCDSNFVPAFNHKGIHKDDWTNIFSTYLNLHLSKRLVEIILDISKELKKENAITFNIKEETETLLKSKNEIDSFHELFSKLKTKEIELINYVNSPKFNEVPQNIFNGHLLNLIAQSVLKQEIFNGKAIHFFIDEFENLLPYQQEVVNTLIKHPNPVIFDVGMRNEGHKTFSTLISSEIISAPHDYDKFNFEDLTDSEYSELIIKICEKRLKEVVEKFDLDQKYLDIRNYLGKYNYKDEIQDLVNPSKLENFQIKIRNIIGIDDEKLSGLFKSEDPLILRLIIVLLDRGVSPEYIAAELIKYEESKESKFKDWIHNNKMGIVFLLCKELKKEKQYAGFSTIKSVSSGIIRYFIEICETAFKNAFRNGFSFEDPRPLTITEQTEACYYISKYKVNDVETYTPHSIRLKRFVMILGRIFSAFHTSKTISEPEQNHFYSLLSKLDSDSQNFIQNALLYSVLQKMEKTKIKSNSLQIENYEYHLNHIYAPYFQISARKQRSIFIPPEVLEKIIVAPDKDARLVAHKYITEKTDDTNSQLKIDF